MNLDMNSPLRNLPVALDRCQSSYLDGIRYSIEMIYLAHSRLSEILFRIATSDLNSEQSVSYINFASAFLDAWSIVDSIHRLRELIKYMPGVKKSGLGIKLFMNKTSTAKEMRNIIQHLRKEIDTMITRNNPILGVLSWYNILDLKTLSGQSCSIVAGRYNDYQLMPIINPLNKQFWGNIDHVVLRCMDIEFTISENVRAVEKLTKSIEKNLLAQFKDQPVANFDICLKVGWQLDGEVTIQTKTNTKF